MFSIFVLFLLCAVSAGLYFYSRVSGNILFKYGSYFAFCFGLVVFLANCYTTVPSGHVKVGSLFGKIKDEPLSEGLHFPVNPLMDFSIVDGRQKTHKERAGVPSEDKLITNVDVSVQYRISKPLAPSMLRETGNSDIAIEVHMIPKLRSILREQGKGVKQAQDFFRESVQVSLQASLQAGLSGHLADKGIIVDQVLIRGVTLPSIITNAIAETKKREQEVIKQKAELERYAMEQDQIIKKAESELEAAKLEAEKKTTLADAEAYQIEVINNQLSKSPNYIKLKQVEQWNGVLPVYAGGDNVPMIDLRK